MAASVDRHWIVGHREHPRTGTNPATVGTLAGIRWPYARDLGGVVGIACQALANDGVVGCAGGESRVLRFYGLDVACLGSESRGFQRSLVRASLGRSDLGLPDALFAALEAASYTSVLVGI